MKKITLSTKTETINTTCAGVSQHAWDQATVHSISAKGMNWINRHESETVTVKTKDGSYRLTEVTKAPLP
jgi:hypothetical protein